MELFKLEEVLGQGSQSFWVRGTPTWVERSAAQLKVNREQNVEIITFV